MPILIGLIGLGISYLALKETKKNNTIAKKGNTIGVVGVLIGTVTSIVMILAFMPESEETFDVKNYYEDGTLHFTGNGTFEDRKDTWKWYSKDGILIKIETYDNNELDGVYKEFYENGNLKIDGKYDDGKKEVDDWKCFNLDGSSKKCEDEQLIQKEKSFLEKTKGFFGF